MRRLLKNIIIVTLLLFSLVLPVFIQESVEAQAASKKTVRVSTQKQLNSALKNSKVKTIVLRTGTYKDITINSDKSENKKIVIDAPNAVITNTAVFKSVEIVAAKKYIEAVSGNSLKLRVNGVLEVAEGIKVKKLVMTEALLDYTVLKNASIKNVIVADENNKSTFDKKTRELSFESVGIWTSFDPDYYETDEEPVTQEYPIYYTAVLDKCGRVLSATYMGWASDYAYEYKYNDDGRCIEYNIYNGETGLLDQTNYYEYDNAGNCVVDKFEHSYENYSCEAINTYDKKGRLIRTTESGKYYTYDTEYSYNKKNLLVGEKTTAIWYEGDNKISSRKSWDASYTYDKNGLLLTEEIVYKEEQFSYLYEYEYDKYGNMIHQTFTYTDKGRKSVSEQRYEYDELGIRVSIEA